MSKITDKTKAETEAENEAARSIAVLLPSLDDGRFNACLSEAFRDLVARMRDDSRDRDSNSKGKLTITLDLKLVDGVFEIKSDYSVKAPHETFGRTLAWATDGNNLVRENPKQERLPFGEVRRVAEPAAVRKVD